ncbi:MAG: tetratricopeptide repeat protein [Hyphomonas sp.]|uniref:tetratricopeptide repeat protein n=1 Tax=Hyphomonas sp. TaxID=87 RepID=UPI003528EB04
MRRQILVSLAVAAVAAILPAAAQSSRVERSQAEIAFEKAEVNFAAKRDARKAAATACAAKDYEACVSQGDLYRKGEGGVQDYDLAAKAYNRACAGGNGEGCASLAYLTSLGRGVETNQTEARRLYKLSCDYGETSGCAGYGNMVFTGTGGPKNTAEGGEALRQSCVQGYKWACTRLQELGGFDPNVPFSEQMMRLRDR